MPRTRAQAQPGSAANSTAAPPPTRVRRSTRIASSRASSVSASEPPPPEEMPLSLPEDGLSIFHSIQHQETATQSFTQEEVVIKKNKRPTRKKTTKANSPAQAQSILSVQEEDEAEHAANEPPFDVDRAVARVHADRAYIHSLTSAQKDAVLNRFVDREIDRRDEIEELQQRNLELEQERDRALKERDSMQRNKFRRHLFNGEMQKKKQERQEQEERAKAAAEQQTPAAEPSTVSKKTPAAEKQPESSLHTQSKSQPAVTPTPSNDTTPTTSFSQETTTPAPTKSFLSRFVGSFSSPFTSRSKNTPQASQPEAQPQLQQQAEQPAQPQEPLGELPSSRKRRAESQEPAIEAAPQRSTVSFTEQSDSTPRAKPASMANQSPRRPHTIHSTRHHNVETPLTTISEHSETSENTFTVPEPTPSRPKPTPRSRPLSLVRAQMAERNASKTPGRPWATQAPAPREPNADARLAKLRRYRDLDFELKKLKSDPEVVQMVSRPIKRVKIDELQSIPHRRPGESGGTFRVPDVDSDGEMEVDEEESTFNIFENDDQSTPIAASTASSASKAPVAQPAAQPEPQAQPVQAPAEIPAEPAVEYIPATVYDWPDVGQGDQDPDNFVYDTLAGAKFTYGYETWLASGGVNGGVSAVTW